METHAPAGIDHIGLNLPQESFGFFQDLLVHLGFEIVPDGSDHFDAIPGSGATMFCVKATDAAFEGDYHRKRTGLGHLAVRVPSRDAVDQFVADFLKPRGIQPLYGRAAEYRYAPGYYAAYTECPFTRVKFEVMTSLVPPAAAQPKIGLDSVSHGTASVFVVEYAQDGWRVLLIMHERLGALTIPGGHEDESDASAAHTAIRETREEAGLDIVLLSRPSPRLPDAFPHQVLPEPWWTVSGAASPDGGARVPHVHVDHQFLALPAGPAHPDAECERVWVNAEELAGRDDCLPDTRMQALAILGQLDRIGPPPGPDALARALYQAMTSA